MIILSIHTSHSNSIICYDFPLPQIQIQELSIVNYPNQLLLVIFQSLEVKSHEAVQNCSRPGSRSGLDTTVDCSLSGCTTLYSTEWTMYTYILTGNKMVNIIRKHVFIVKTKFVCIHFVKIEHHFLFVLVDMLLTCSYWHQNIVTWQ